MGFMFWSGLMRWAWPLASLALLVAIGLGLSRALAVHDARLLAACDARHAALAFQAQAAARAEEQRRVLAQAEVALEAQRQAERLRSDRAAVDAAAAGLRRAAARAAGERARPSDPPAPTIRPPAPDSTGVLALVLGETEERLRTLAALADERYSAGVACEWAYRALMPAW
jgi:hypothetical protein